MLMGHQKAPSSLRISMQILTHSSQIKFFFGPAIKRKAFSLFVPQNEQRMFLFFCGCSSLFVSAIINLLFTPSKIRIHILSAGFLVPKF
jgi:hypothetical protein